MRDRKQNPVIPNRFDSQQRNAKQSHRQLNRRTLDLQPMTKNSNAVNRNLSNKKDNDN
jgi:hypothetical protein